MPPLMFTWLHSVGKDSGGFPSLQEQVFCPASSVLPPTRCSTSCKEPVKDVASKPTFRALPGKQRAEV